MKNDSKQFVSRGEEAFFYPGFGIADRIRPGSLFAKGSALGLNKILFPFVCWAAAALFSIELAQVSFPLGAAVFLAAGVIYFCALLRGAFGARQLRSEPVTARMRVRDRVKVRNRRQRRWRQAMQLRLTRVIPRVPARA